METLGSGRPEDCLKTKLNVNGAFNSRLCQLINLYLSDAAGVCVYVCVRVHACAEPLSHSRRTRLVATLQNKKQTDRI